MRRLLFVALFAAAVLLLSEALAVWRAAVTQPTPEAWARVALAWGLLVVLIVALGFLMYAADRAIGRVRRQIRLYEWLLSRGVGSRA